MEEAGALVWKWGPGAPAFGCSCLLLSHGRRDRRAAGSGLDSKATATPGCLLRRKSLALVVAVGRAALPGEAVAGARPPERVHLRRLRVAAAGDAVTEAGEGRPDFDALCRDRALDRLPELERGEGHTLQPSPPGGWT